MKWVSLAVRAIFHLGITRTLKNRQNFPRIDGKRWSITGDAARLEDDGMITIFGRGSTRINSGGEKSFPEEVEPVLRAHTDILDANGNW